MDREALKAIQANPESVVRFVARQRFITFARYMMPKMEITNFHKVYYEVLDRFAHKQIKRLIVSVPPQHGKALSIDTPVLTTKGWKRHCDLQVGDEVFGDDGQPKKVLWNSGVYDWPTMSVDFADGFSMIAAREHEWKVYCDHDDHKGRVEEVLETQNIFKRRHHRAPFIKGDCGIDMPERELPVEPYLLGYWLGDGYSQNGTICSGEEDAWNLAQFGEVKIQKKGHTTPYYRVNVVGLAHKLRIMGLQNNKHIPIEYLLSSRAQRLALLQGLMDTDGCVNIGRGMCEFCQKKNQLAEDVYVLLRSLGFKPVMHEYAMMLNGKNVGRKVRICFVPNKGDKIFRLPRKQERLDNKTTADRTDKTRLFITNISDAGNTLVNCIQVEGGMYLAGYELVPTHNSLGSSRFLPSFLLGLNPDLKIVIGSYSADQAKTFNRDVQRIVNSEAYKAVFPDTFFNNGKVRMDNVYQCNSEISEPVGHSGFVRAVGRNGSLTGKSVDVAILDDVYKDFNEANSKLIREQAWMWYVNVVRTRLHNNSQEIIVFTRWHEDDLIGRLENSGEKIVPLKSMSDLDNIPDGAWVQVNFPALKVGEPTELDPRQEGEALWPERHSKEELLAAKALDPVQFECLYQGSPTSAEGLLYGPFKTYVDPNDYGVLIRKGTLIDVADKGTDDLVAISYQIRKSPNTIFNEQTKKFEPIMFLLPVDVLMTPEGTEITKVSVPMMVNSNGTQLTWVESNNGGEQFANDIAKRMRCTVVTYHTGANKESRIVSNAGAVMQSVVMPHDWETRWPRFHKAITHFLRNFIGNVHDDAPDALTAAVEKEILSGNTKPYTQLRRGIKRRN